MKYKTQGELSHFDFEDAVFDGLDFGPSSVHLYFENVKILPENSENRDIRTMRTNDLKVTLEGGSITEIREEGYRLYDADFRPYKSVPDRIIESSAYEETLKEMAGFSLDGEEEADGVYTFHLRDEDHTWVLTISAAGDIQEWDKFISAE